MNRLLLALVLLSPLAFADRTITVDGNAADWAGVTTCYNEAAGDGAGGIDLDRTCVENDNTSGSNGYRYNLFHATTTLPTTVDTYFGFIVDVNHDGVIQDSDEAWAVFFPGVNRNPSANAAQIQVYSAVNFNLLRSYSNTATCNASVPNGGWTGTRSGATVEMRVSYACLGLTSTTDYGLTESGTYPNFDTTPTAYYDGNNGTLDQTVTTVPDVKLLTSTAKPGTVRLDWTNPAPHRGVLIVRRDGGQPSAPTARVTYSAGQTFGTATTVVYADDYPSTVSSFVDSGLIGGLTAGHTYWYDVYNHAQGHTYSLNQASSGLITGIPGGDGAVSPLWCYSTGYVNLAQPVTDTGSSVFNAGNSGGLTGNLTTPGNPATDGLEKFRPVALAGAVQNRFVMTRFQGDSDTAAVVADQTGRVYKIWTSGANAGTVQWTNSSLGTTAIQGQPVVQLYASSNQAFRNANPGRDLIWVGTQDTGTSSNNHVYALSSVTGAVVLTYSPGDLDTISGALLVDVANNRVYVGSTLSNKHEPFRILNSLTGGDLNGTSSRYSSLGGKTIGSVTTGVVLGRSSAGQNLAMFGDSGGAVFAIDLATASASSAWSYDTGNSAFAAFPFPLVGGFITARVNGTVDRYSFSTASPPAVSQLWSANVPSPSGIKFDQASQKVFVGSSGGKLAVLDVGTGAVVFKQIAGSGVSAVGTPTIDNAVSRLHVALSDGRLCAYQLPLP